MRDNKSLEEAWANCEPLLASGACILRDGKAAKIVRDALRYFEGERYYLSAWCIMPNHVHAVITPLGEYKLSAILHSWKSFTSNEINKFLGRTGRLWERESFDHLIRTSEYFTQLIVYTEYNPVNAGFCKKPQEWPFSSCSANLNGDTNLNVGEGQNCDAGNCGAGKNCGAGFQPAFSTFIDPRQTPFVELSTRGELPHLEKEGGSYFVTFCLADAIRPGRKNEASLPT